jgi:CDP-glycerol glycerophosphotransferase
LTLEHQALSLPVPSGIERVGDSIRLRLSCSQPTEGLNCRLVLIRRGDKAQIDIDCIPITAGFEALLPVAGVLVEQGARWDARLHVSAAAGAEDIQLVAEYRPVGSARHFFNECFTDHGVSAYLSDSVSSLVFYIAPSEHHARVVAGENAKQLFAEYLADLPLQHDLVIFESFLGKSYSGNPRYIYEALIKLRPDLRCVWAYNGHQAIPGNPLIVQRGSPDYFRLLAQAKYRVNNVIFAGHGKKPETIYLQTWHGTPLKRLSFDIEVSGPEVDARDNFYRESRAWSVLLSENAYSSEVFQRAFRYAGPILELGYPLTDPLLQVQDQPALLERLGLPTGKRFILYAPTWRDHKAIGAWQHEFDLQLDLQAFAAALEADQMLLIKAHHLVSQALDAASLPGNVIDMSHLDDINELCMIADVLITDYSSVFFDFAVTGKPILFYCYDLELYASQIRGFYLSVESDLPGPVAQTTGQLIALLQDVQAVAQRYAPRYAEFRQRFCALNDGQVTRRVIQAVFGGGIGN